MAMLHPFDPKVNTPRPNADGTVSTELTRTVQFPDGSWGNVPSLWWGDGSNYKDFGPMTDDQIAEFASRYEQQAGAKFPRFADLTQAETAAKTRSAAGGGENGAITASPAAASGGIKISDIRAKYPQYQDLSDQQLADALHAKFYSDMPRAEFDSKIGLAPASPDMPPAGAKPGSKEYADWAMLQARAGKELPQVTKDLGFQNPYSDLGGKFVAGYTSAVDAVPFVGPTLLDWAQKGKAAVQGVPLEDVQRDTRLSREANPITSGAGTVAGAVLPFIAAGGIPGVGRVLGMAGSLPSRIGFGSVSSGLITAGDTLARGGSIEDATKNGAVGFGIGAAAPLVFAGGGKLVNALTGKSAPKSAVNVGKALAEDGIDAASVPGKLAALGPDAMLMDLGPNLQTRAGALAAVPGAAQKTIREAVTARSAPAAKAGRVAADVNATIGQGPDIDLLKNQIVTAQKAAADPLYTAVRDVPVPVAGNVKFVLQTPMGQQAFREAGKMAANDGIKVNGLTIGIVDYAKQALDDIVTAAIREGKNNVARQADQLRNLLKAEADKIAPDYKAAREAYAGPAAVMEAVDNGAAVFSKDVTPAQLARNLSNMTAGEKDAFLQGARSWVESQLGNAVNDVASLRNMFRKGWNEAKLRIILGDDVADDLLKRIDRESVYGKTSNVVEGNSETARRMAAMGEVAPETKDLSQTNWFGAVLAAFNKARAGIAGVGQKKVNQDMASLLTSKNATASQIRALTNGAAPKLPGVIAPGGIGDLVAIPEKRKPIEITIGTRGL